MISFPKVTFGQHSSDDLYNLLDEFVAKPSPIGLTNLEKKTTLFEKEAKDKNDFLTLTIVTTNIGYYYQQFGNLNKSIINYEKAWSLFERYSLTDYDIYENCLLPLSKIYTQQGDFLKAEELLKRCYIHAEKVQDKSLLAQITLSISALYSSLGNYNAAVKVLKSTLSQTKLSPEIKQLLENNLATSYIGLKKYTEAKEILTRIVSNKKSEQLNSYKNLAFIAIQEKNLTLANEYFAKAEIALKNEKVYSSRDFVHLHIEKAELYLVSGNSEETKTELSSALKLMLPSYQGTNLPSKELLYADLNFIRIFDIYAELLPITKDRLKAYDLSFYIENLQVFNYTSQETKIIHQTAHKQRTEKCITLLWEAYLNNTNVKGIQSAFVYAENSKSSVLLEKIQENNKDSDSLNAIYQKKLHASREKLTDDLLRVQFKKLGVEKANEIVKQIQKIDREISLLKSQQIIKLEDKVFDFDLLKQKLITDNATLISYFIGKENSFQFIVEATGLSMLRISDQQNFEASIKNFIHYFNSPTTINNEVTNFTNSAYNTFNIVQLDGVTKSPNLVIIPDGLLNFLPFESLLTEPTKSVSFAKMPFLVKQKAVAYAYNAYDYLQPKEETELPKILGVFPVFEGSNFELRYSVEEEKGIKEYFNLTTLLRQEATKSNFLVSAKKSSLIHLSTHAGSGDFIVPAHIQFIDDILYLPELYSLNMTNKTVVLSACETGIGKLQSGEGAISIARAFKYAGASKVLFTLWEVNDKSTSQVMSAFYKNLKESNSVFQSNHSAKLDYLNNPDISNLKKSPYYWNSFTYYGPIDSNLKNMTNNRWIFDVIVGILFIIVAIYWYKKRFKS